MSQGEHLELNANDLHLHYCLIRSIRCPGEREVFGPITMRRAGDSLGPVRHGTAEEVRHVPSATGHVRRITSASLFAGANEVIVVHEGSDYRLRCTSKGKLILTK